jgi:hypothetical protein
MLEEQLSLFEYANKNDNGDDKIYLDIEVINEIYSQLLKEYFNTWRIVYTITDVPASALIVELRKYVNTRSKS